MSYEVRLAPAAARQFRKLPGKTKAGVRKALEKVADRPAGSRGGKSLKKLRGKDGDLFRLRVGDHRVMFDILDADRVILVLGIVSRGDLERWLRGR